jgi:sugar lactone lactonase YvrE
MTDIQCVVDAKAQLGEATCWDADEECLWWVDIYGRMIHRYDPSRSEIKTFSAPARPGSLAVRAQGGLVVAMGNGFHFFDPKTHQFKLIIDVDPGNANTHMNDGKTDRQGRFWSGTEFETEGKPAQSAAALYRLDADLCCRKMIDGVTCANGLAWSPDGRTMYFTDSGTPYVWAWSFDAASGDIENRRVFIDLSSINGIGDGATVDSDGCYWLTMPFRGEVRRYDPRGKLMQAIHLPTDTPTCCEFGGKDLAILYVTTATLKRSPQELTHQPRAGGLFAIDAGVKGLRSLAFKG